MKKFDPVEFLENDGVISGFLQSAAVRDNDKHFLNCLSHAMRAGAINQLALKTGIEREAICELFSSSAPDPSIVARVKEAFGAPVKELSQAKTESLELKS